jgi:hypothetical protein
VVTLEGLVLHLRQQVVRTVKRLHGADQNPHLIMSSNAPWELARHASRRPDPGAAAAAGLRLVATHVVPPGPGQVGYVRLRLLGADGLPLSGQALTARYRSGGADAVTKLEPTSAEGYAVVPVARPTANADDLVLEVTYDGKAGKVSLVVAGLSDSR